LKKSSFAKSQASKFFHFKGALVSNNQSCIRGKFVLSY